MTRGLIENTFRESLNRRGGMILLGTGLVTAIALSIAQSFAVENGRVVVYAIGASKSIDGVVFAVSSLQEWMKMLTGIWLFVSIFVIAGLMTSPFEKGYVEMLLSKPVSRTRLLLGKYFGIVLLALTPVLAIALVPFATYRAHVYFPVAPYLRSVLMLIFLYATFLAVMQLLAVLQPHTGLLVLSSFGIIVTSFVLYDRHLTLITVTDTTVNRIANILYYVFPKFSEVILIGNGRIGNIPVETWMPVWSTGLFSAACLALAAFLFSRRNY